MTLTHLTSQSPKSGMSSHLLPVWFQRRNTLSISSTITTLNVQCKRLLVVINKAALSPEAWEAECWIELMAPSVGSLSCSSYSNLICSSVSHRALSSFLSNPNFLFLFEEYVDPSSSWPSLKLSILYTLSFLWKMVRNPCKYFTTNWKRIRMCSAVAR